MSFKFVCILFFLKSMFAAKKIYFYFTKKMGSFLSIVSWLFGDQDPPAAPALPAPQLVAPPPQQVVPPPQLGLPPMWLVPDAG
jgi:hypothetical protein